MKKTIHQKDKEREEKIISKIIARIQKLEGVYPQFLLERAIFRYKTANADRRKALKDKEELEIKLAEANKKLNKR
jgi:hypothetical protein